MSADPYVHWRADRAKLKAVMREKDLNGSQLAEAAGLNRTTPWAILRGQSHGTLESLTAIAGALGVDIDKIADRV